MSFKRTLLQAFTWWNGATWGTRLDMWRRGKAVGTDLYGNRYYQTPNGERYVLYAGEADPSMVPAGWSGWIHHRTDVPPPESDYVVREWELPHERNYTGTARAYRPKGSVLRPGERPVTQQEYEAWTPDGEVTRTARRPEGSGSADFRTADHDDPMDARDPDNAKVGDKGDDYQAWTP